MRTDNACRDPINPTRVQYAVERLLDSGAGRKWFLNELVEQGVLTPTELPGIQITRAVVIDLADGRVVVVNAMGLVL